MKLMRFLCALSLGLSLMTSAGCGQRSIILPTDEEARRRAEPQPPPPVAFGGNPNAKTGADNPLQTVGIPSPDSKAGEKK